MFKKDKMAVLFLMLVCASIHAAPVLDVTFDGLTAGTIDTVGANPPTLTQLNTATTGGSWSLDVSLGRVQSIEPDVGGDQAFLGTDSSGNDSAELGRVVLDTTVTLAGLASNNRSLDLSLETAARDVGAGKAYHYVLMNSNQDKVFDLEWSDNGGGDSTIVVNGNTVTATGPALTALVAWDSASGLIQALQLSVAGNGAFSGSFAGVSFSGTLQNIGSFANVDAFQVEHDGTVAGAKGVYVNDLTMALTTYEQGTVCMFH